MRKLPPTAERRVSRLLRAAAVLCLATSTMAATLDPLHVDGARLLNPAGEAVVLHGVNLGNWLLLEPWICALDTHVYADQYTIVQTLNERFGRDEAERLLDLYRANWITPREMDVVRSCGFNAVRLPFDYELLARDESPYELRPDAFEWLDRGVDMAEAAGIYVILDMHGAPGRQSHDMPSGRAKFNQLFDSDEYQKRTAWLWERIAERYRSRAAVAAYDLLNEPWYDFKTDHRPRLAALMDKLVAAVRNADADKLIFVAAPLQGIAFYGKPGDRGWKNVGFTDHFYPGLFGQGSPTLETHTRFITRFLPMQRRLVDSREAPYLIGEFNVVFDDAGRTDLMRQYFDTYASYGWHATMWSLRLIFPEGTRPARNWAIIHNAEPFRLPDFRTASAAEIEAAFKMLSKQPIAVDEELRDCLTTKTPRETLVTEKPSLVVRVPAAAIPGWTGTTIGSQRSGGAAAKPGNVVTIYGVGQDIFGSRDELYFLHMPAPDEIVSRAWVTNFDPAARYAKAGLMLRATVEPDAAHVFVHLFGDGRVSLCWREAPGGESKERVLGLAGLPAGLGIERRGGQIIAHYCGPDGRWRQADVPEIAALSTGGLVGLAANSNHDLAFVPVSFRLLGQGDAWKPDAPASSNLITNGSFEDVGSADDRAANWERWGQWFNREGGWTPTRDGKCVLGYHHFRIESADNSGWYQDVSGLATGERYEFRVDANADRPADGKKGPQSVELAIEAPYRGRTLKIASQTYTADALATGDAWSNLKVTGVIPGDRARVLIIVNPSADGPRDAALKFDSASFLRASAPQ